MATSLDSFSASPWTNNSNVTLSQRVSSNQSVLVVFVQIATAGTPSATATYSGRSMTAIQSNFTYASSGLGGAIFVLKNPPVGTANIVVTLSANAITTNTKVTGISLLGATDVGNSTLVQSLAAQQSASVAAGFAGDWVLTANTLDGNDNLAAPNGFTLVTNNGTATSTVGAGAVAYTGPISKAGNVPLAWTSNSSDNNFAMSVVVTSNTPAYKGPIKISPSLGALNSSQSSSQLVRTSTGNLYAVLVTGGKVTVWKSTNNGVSWAQQDYRNVPSTAGTIVAAAIDGSDIMHITYPSLATKLNYIQFSTSTDTFGGPEKIPVAQASPTAFNSVAIAVDSNNTPHVVEANSASVGTKLGYNNRVGGRWNPGVIISTTQSALNLDIQIDQNNIPQFTGIVTSTPILYIGNKNNANSFTANNTISNVTATGGISLAIDSAFNSWLAIQGLNSSTVQLIKHNQTDDWTITQTPVTDNFSGKSVSLAADASDIYVFYERNLGGIAYNRYDTINGKWLGETILQPATPSFRPHNPFVKWSQYFNNGDTGANNANQQTIEYLFDDGSTVYYDKLTTAQISTGLAQISFTPVAAAFTTSTSSTSSSTSTSTSTSSTSTSTSTSTSSTSQSTSTSISTSSTSSSTSTSISTSSTSTSISTSSTSQSMSTSSTSASTSISTSSTSTSLSTSTSTTLPPTTGGLAFGEQNPTHGETASSWALWDNGSSGVVTVIGDANWGKLQLSTGNEGRSLVYDFGDSNQRLYTLTSNRYGTGQGTATLQIRGDTTIFSQDNNTLGWTTYGGATTQNWRYVQVREVA